MRASHTTTPSGHGRGHRPSAAGPRAVVVAPAPVLSAAAMLRRSVGPAGTLRRPAQARVPAESRLVWRSGVVRVG